MSGSPVESISSLSAPAKLSSLGLEVIHRHGRQGTGIMVLGSVVVNFVHWDSMMNDVGLDGLLVDNRLDGLVDVVVHVLATDGRLDSASGLSLNTGG